MRGSGGDFIYHLMEEKKTGPNPDTHFHCAYLYSLGERRHEYHFAAYTFAGLRSAPLFLFLLQGMDLKEETLRTQSANQSIESSSGPFNISTESMNLGRIEDLLSHYLKSVPCPDTHLKGSQAILLSLFRP